MDNKQTIINNNLELENIKNTINELPDFVDTTNANATANDIIQGKTAYVNDEKLEGTIPNNGELSYTPSLEEQAIPEGYTSGGVIEAIEDENLLPENIKKDVEILGVTGTLESGGGGGINIEIISREGSLTTMYGTPGIMQSIDKISDGFTWTNSAKCLFLYAKYLREIGNIDLSECTELDYAFAYCSNLITVGNIKLGSNTRSMTAMFLNCSNLSDESLNNILAMCITANNISANNKKLSYIQLSATQRTKCETLPNYQAFLDAGWTAN